MSSTNRRSHFRVEILIPVRWRVLNKKETEMVEKGLGQSLFRKDGLPNPIDELLEQVTPGSNEEQIFRSLQLLNNKLDFIIEQILSESVESMPGRDDLIEISASGLKFSTREKVDVGEFLKMSLFMPGTIQYQIELVARTLRVEAYDNGSIIAARIIHIDDDARDSIVKTVFQKQRLDIRRIKTDNRQENVE
jgi:hypothetical protein